MSSQRDKPFDILCALVNPYIDNKESLFKLINLEDCNWEEVWRIADITHCLPELYTSICRLKIQEYVPIDLLSTLTLIYDLLIEKNRSIQSELKEITSILNAINISPIWLKGATLLLSENWTHNTRFINDLDFWIPREAEQLKAINALEENGYKLKPKTKEHFWDKSHHFAPRFHTDRPAAIEIHKNIIASTWSFLIDDKKALNNVQWTKWKSLKIGVLSQNDQIMHSFVQNTVMATPPIESGCIRMMKVLYLIRLLHEGGHKSIPNFLTSRLNKQELDKSIPSFFTFLAQQFDIKNPLKHSDYSLLDGLEKNNYTLIGISKYLRKQSLKPPSNWLNFLSNPRDWLTKIKLRYIMFLGQDP